MFGELAPKLQGINTKLILPIGSGGTGQSIIPCFYAGLTANQTGIVSNTYTKVNLNSITFDNNSDFSGGVHTPKIAGTYLYTATVAFANGTISNAGLLIAAIIKNGGFVGISFVIANTTGEQAVCTTTIVTMNGTTDNVQLDCFATSGGTATIETPFTYLTGVRVGA